MLKKHLLVVRSGYPSKEFVLKRLRDLGYYLIILDKEKNCPDTLVDEWIIADISEPSAAVAAVREYLKVPEHSIEGAITFWEEAVITTAAITDAFGLVGIPYTSADIIKNKHSFRKLCASNNLPAPKSHLIKTAADFVEIEENLRFPLVIKPVYGAASAFVKKVNNLEELKLAYYTINESIRTFWLAPEWQSIELYVEEYIEGQEVDIDILLQDGKCLFYSITDNFLTQEPYFIETGQALPSALSKQKQNELIDMALKVLDKAGVKNGSIHFEAKSSPNGPFPIEINLRMGGDHVYSFVHEGWGVCMIEYAAKIACGEKCSVRKPNKPLAYLEGKYFEPTHAGVISEITYPDDLLQNPHLSRLHFDMHIGDKVLIPPQGFDFFGWMTVRGNSKSAAVAVLKKLFPLVKFEVHNYETVYI